ncbi:MAG: riboflavin synthase [Bacteroidetes bacterium]|nr:MAG: riboflavin synthase [Bacteroidota bacterium]
MFTGIVETVGTVRSVTRMGDGLQFVIAAPRIFRGMAVDNSICVNGVCLTVVRKTAGTVTVQVVKETLRKTNLGLLGAGSEVNLERSVRLNDRLGGHIVQGHVDATGVVRKVETLESSWMYTIAFPASFRKYLISVGSVSVDGTSLTVARLGRTAFTVAIIPYTHEHTVFHSYRKGSVVNLEFDVIGKYIESIVTYGSK